MFARDVMSEEGVSVSGSTTVFDAAKFLLNAGLTAVPVIDDSGSMIGIVSEADLLRGAANATKSVGQGVLGKVEDDAHAIAAVAAAKTQCVANVMTRGVISVHETATLREVARIMMLHRIKRVPVVRDHKILGVVSRADLLKALISFGAPVYAAEGEPEKRTSRELRAAVLAALKGHSWSEALWCDAVASAGTVHLWGIVPSDSVRQAYVTAAEKVEGVTSVSSHMHVAQRTGQGDVCVLASGGAARKRELAKEGGDRWLFEVASGTVHVNDRSS